MSDLDDLRSALRGYLEAGHGRRGQFGAAPLDRERWQRLASELGVPGVRIAESLGGTGLGLEHELAVHEEFGRVLSDLPVLSTVGFAGAVLAETGSDDELEAVAAGALVVACVLEGQVTIQDGVADGIAHCVLDAPDADGFLVLSGASSGASSCEVAWIDRADVTVRQLESIDLTRRYGVVDFAGARARVLATGSAGQRAARAARTNGFLALCAENLGVAARTLELTVDYVKVRHQFGRAIGGFQAVKHRCADMIVDLERARSALAFAVHAVAADADEADRSTGDADAALAVARLFCAAAPIRIATDTIHLHGGIGFTWEHQAHLYFRRAKANQLWLDPHGGQRRRVASLVTDLYAREESAR